MGVVGEAAAVAPVLPGAARAAPPLAGEALPVAAPAPLLGADDPRTVVGAAAAAALSVVTGERSERERWASLPGRSRYMLLQQQG